MENITSGVSAIILCTIIYCFSWRKFNSKQYTFSIFLLLLAGLILRIYISSDFYLHSWDERFHALVAKNLINHHLKPTLYDNPILQYDYKCWVGNHIWVHKQPLSLWTIALSLWIFGINEIALRLPSIILTTVGCLLTYQIGRSLLNRKIGLIASFLFSIHGLILEVTGGRVATDHVDVFFLFFIELSVFFAILFAQKKKFLYNVICGISIGSAILSKWLPALIVLPIWLLLVFHSKKFTFKEIVFNLSILCFVIIIIALPWQIYIHNSFPLEATWESSFNSKHLTEVIENRGGPFYYHLDKMRIIYGELIYIPIIWFSYKTLKHRKNFIRWALLMWIAIPYLFFSIAETKMQGYTLFTAPAIFIVTALFWQYLNIYRRRFKYKWVILTIQILLIALPVRYSIERLKLKLCFTLILLLMKKFLVLLPLIICLKKDIIYTLTIMGLLIQESKS